ncbi:putative monooxygenase [Flavihumibacter petaseus NBRC 106054]|uniref:Putative monooxygenase n=2 Tax=Flavihumibacter TaxID=1004301 RepID=A0A0E9N557_9BACT|nr:putative monooxygenase [Flavihumibacter petaseus NBRC 106054]
MEDNKTWSEWSIIGGGIAGLTAAIALERAGITATLFEAADSWKEVGAGIALAPNAMAALARLGVEAEVITAGNPLQSFSILDEGGRCITKTDLRRLHQQFGHENLTIHRADLQGILLNNIVETTLIMGKRAIALSSTGEEQALTFADGTRHLTRYLIVADGIHSPIRQQLIPGSVPRYAGYTCWRGIADNTQLQCKDTSETWAPGGRFGIVPLKQNRTYWFACVNGPKADPFFRSCQLEDLHRIFRNYHAPVRELLLRTPPENLVWGDIMDLAPLDRFAFGNIVLIGDAAHATTPNMGQGACMAIEDGELLGALLSERIPSDAFILFEDKRLKRTRNVVTQSRRIGRMAQCNRPFLVRSRNTLMRLLPARMNEIQLKRAYGEIR